MVESNVSLDVRDMQPKLRFDSIMEAWRSVPKGRSLFLKVDHDPKCMYYTLLEEYGPDAFTYNCLMDGPEVWEVQVTRL